MSTTLIFEDDLEGFSLEIDGKNQFDLSRRNELNEHISSLEEAFQKVYRGLDLEQFQFTVADSETVQPKIHIYMRSPNQAIEGLGVLSRKELFQFLENMNEKNLEDIQSNVSGRPAPGRNENEIKPKDSSVGDAQNFEGDDSHNPLKEASTKNVHIKSNGADPATKKPNADFSSEDESTTSNENSNKQLEISDGVDGNGNSLKKDFDIRTEIIRILEVSGETQFRRFTAATTDGRSLKFQASEDDQLLKVEMSKLFKLPCNVEYDALATKKQTYKDYRKIIFEEQIEEFFRNLVVLKKLPTFEQRAEFLAEINRMLSDVQSKTI